MRADDAIASHARGSEQKAHRPDLGILCDLHIGTDPGGSRIDDRDPVFHVSSVDARLQTSTRLGKLRARIDAHALERIFSAKAADRATSLVSKRKHIGKIVFTLNVLGRNLIERGEKELLVEAVEARIAFVDRNLLRRAIFMLHDRTYPTLRITHDATIARRILHLHAQHYDRRLRSLLCFYQCSDRFRSNERGIAREHHERARRLSEHLTRSHHRMRSSKLLFLNNDLRVFDQWLDKFATMADNGDHRFDASTMGCIDHPANEGFFKYLMCHFWLG